MQHRRRFVIMALAAAILTAGGLLAQEVPDEPEAPQAPEAAQAPEAPEATEAPEAAAAPVAPTEPAAPPPSLAFETSVAFEPVKKISFEGRAGEVELRGVEFTVAAAKGGMLGTSDADLKATISIMLECATSADKKAKLDVTIFFLDGDGNVIDRTGESCGLKAESKIFEIKHTTLKYVVPLIKSVKISAVAKQ
jgi:hypothetical protein